MLQCFNFGQIIEPRCPNILDIYTNIRQYPSFIPEYYGKCTGYL